MPGTTDIYSAQCHYTKSTASDQPENRALLYFSHSYGHVITAWEIRAGVSSVPAGVHRKIFSVVSIFLVLLKVQLGQKLAGLHHCIVSVGQNTIRSIHLNTKHVTSTPPPFSTSKSQIIQAWRQEIQSGAHLTLKTHTSATYTNRNAVKSSINAHLIY